MIIEQFPIAPNTGMLTETIKSYLYQEYSDDEDLQAFVNTFNDLSQGYLDWFNTVPLALYTSDNITGYLLDWIAKGIYGINRPVVSTSPSPFALATGQYNSVSWNTTPWNGFNIDLNGGSSATATDDIYKRLMTWILYRGDGKQMSVQWLRRRVARFLYGENGSDIDIGLVSTIDIQIVGRNVTIRVPAIDSASSLATLIYQNFIPLPFQLKFNVAV